MLEIRGNMGKCKPEGLCFRYFSYRVSLYAWANLDHNPIYASHLAGSTVTPHCSQLLLVEMGGLTNFFLLGMALNFNLPK
jgi:hypothetical protein